MTQSMDINTFKQAFDGGTRPNRFVVTVNLGSVGDLTNPLMVKAASMPAETLGIIQVPFRGRVAKLPGDRAYPEWTFTLIDTATARDRTRFEEWHELFNAHEMNVPANVTSLAGRGGAYGTATVQQIDMMGGPLQCKQMNVCWPVEVGAIDLSYDTADTLTEYSITLAYDYLSPCAAAATPPAGGGANTTSGDGVVPGQNTTGEDAVPDGMIP